MSRNVKTEEFVKKAMKTHGTRYDYDKVNYTRACDKITIICKIHGEFKQVANNHLNGKGCKKCASKKLLHTTRQFIKNSRMVHGDKYDYSLSSYVGWDKKIKIICLTHGGFLQIPNNHLRGHGCPKCAFKMVNYILRGNIDKFIKKSKKIHGNKYNYSKAKYKDSYTKLEILCPRHGSFFQKPNGHLTGKGCIKCSHIISKPETEFLNHLNILTRNYTLPEWKLKRADGYDEKSNTIYEFLGDYWHGNPKIFNKNDVNTRAHKTFGELYKNTIKMLNRLKSFGYNIKYIWESDWDYFRNGKTDTLSVISY